MGKAIIMKTKATFFIFLAVLCVFTACNTNSIYFDIEQQSVVRCKGIISNLYIISKDNEDYLHFTISKGRKGSNMLTINKLNENYSIEVIRTHIDLQNFKLRPETEYEIINHSNGDASDGKLLIRTNKNSFVIYTNKISCE